jgi:hypothetical protein
MNSKVKRSPHDTVEASMKRTKETFISSLWSIATPIDQASDDGVNGWKAKVFNANWSVKTLHHFVYMKIEKKQGL